MLEAYEAYGDYNTMAALTHEIVLDAALLAICHALIACGWKLKA